MPFGDGTANIGVRIKVESLTDLIPIEASEIVHLAHRHGGDERQSDHIESLGELNIDNERN